MADYDCSLGNSFEASGAGPVVPAGIEQQYDCGLGDSFESSGAGPVVPAGIEQQFDCGLGDSFESSGAGPVVPIPMETQKDICINMQLGDPPSDSSAAIIRVVPRLTRNTE